MKTITLVYLTNFVFRGTLKEGIIPKGATIGIGSFRYLHDNVFSILCNQLIIILSLVC